MEEDYCSLEIAKLLKEKGFDGECSFAFYKDGTIVGRYDSEFSYNYYDRPTLQMTMKWLREVHHLHIEVYRTACGYLYIISRIPTGSDLYSDGEAYDGDDENSGQWTTYEKACESAIKYCLENLI